MNKILDWVAIVIIALFCIYCILIILYISYMPPILVSVATGVFFTIWAEWGKINDRV